MVVENKYSVIINFLNNPQALRFRDFISGTIIIKTGQIRISVKTGDYQNLFRFFYNFSFAPFNKNCNEKYLR